MKEEIHLPFPQEFLAVKQGIKPVMRKNFFVKEYVEMKRVENQIERICKEFKLQFLFKDIGNERVLYISKNKDIAKNAYVAEKTNNPKIFGKLLGYPECCVDFYTNIWQSDIRTSTKEGGNFSFVYLTLNRTKSKPKFYLNNIFNIQSRIFTDDMFSDYKKLLSISKFHMWRFYIISHVPCSYECKESTKLAKSIMKIMKRKIPTLTGEIVKALKRPFLFFDDFNWIAFDGFVRGNEIIYDQVAPYRSLYSQRKFKKGDIVKISDKEILVFKEREMIHKIKKKNEQEGIIIDFS